MKVPVRIGLAVLSSTIAVVPLYILLVLFSRDLENPFLLPVLYGALMFSAIGVCVVGLPTHFILGALKKQQWYFYAGPGFFVPATLVLLTHPFGEDGNPAILIQALQMGVFGVGVALVFWGIAVPRAAP